MLGMRVPGWNYEHVDVYVWESLSMCVTVPACNYVFGMPYVRLCFQAAIVYLRMNSSCRGESKKDLDLGDGSPPASFLPSILGLQGIEKSE